MSHYEISPVEQDCWGPSSARSVLDGDEVHVWRVSLAQAETTVDIVESILTADEKQRANRFVVKRDRDRFIVARGVLRMLLGGYVQCEPRQLRFSYSEHGKPYLENSNNIFFNVSHSHAMAVFAFGRGRHVGVDIEYMRRDLDITAIATRFFSPREVAALSGLPTDLQAQAFFNCWTRKEAYIKARGEGIFFGLDNFDVSLAPGEAATLLRVEGQPAELSRWTYRPLPVHPDYAGVAIAEGNWRLKCWEYSLTF